MIRLPRLKSRHKEILKLVKNSWLGLFFAMGCMVVMAGTDAATAYLIKPALDDVFINKDARMLKLIPLAILCVYLLRCPSMFGQRYLMNRVGQNIIRRLRNRLYNRIIDLPISFFHKEKTGVLMSRITNDVGIINEMISNVVTGAIRDCFTVVGLTCVIFYQIWDLALLALIILPLAFYPIVYFGRRMRRISTRSQEAMGDISTFLHETLSGNKIVKAFGAEAFEKERFSRKTMTFFKYRMKEVAIKALSSPVMEFLSGIGIAAVIFYGGSRVIAGHYTTGTFMSFLGAVLMLYAPIKKLSKLNNHVQNGLAATDRVFDFIETPSKVAEIDQPKRIPDGSHRVTFDNVVFSYDSDPVLRGINLDVAPGEIVALVGMSGGGKTSLVNLIPRFYDVKQGAVKIDGLDVRSASLASLRSQIALVTQEPILFDDTIFNNIAYGNRGASPDAVKAAARAAYAYGFIETLPKKFDTTIGELGSRLSGGEKQRLCIARALLKDAPILILDEATSSLDTEAETLVQSALENLMKGRTTFVIAHRLSTIDYAHRIIVIVKGRIVEEGRHDELMASKGEYHKLYRMQFRNNTGTI